MHYLDAEDAATMRKIGVNVGVLVAVAFALLAITILVA